MNLTAKKQGRPELSPEVRAKRDTAKILTVRLAPQVYTAMRVRAAMLDMGSSEYVASLILADV
jgi:hypothetical protein